jgi:ATP-dependent DNA ligase
MYSREKSEYPGLDHIRNEQKKLLTFIKQLINDNLLFNSDGEPNNVWLPNNDPDICPIYLDGEIYKHGVSLLYIAGQSRRDTDNSDLEYHIFDLIFTTKMDMESKERQFILSEIFKMYTDYTFSMNGPLHYLHRVPNHKPNTLDEVFLLKDSYVRHGYEGIIVRRDSGLYKFSYNKARTSDIVKIKAKFTDEFKCIGYTQGEKGKDIGAIIWICETEDHKQFNVVPKNMTYQERYRIFEIVNTGDNFDKYIKGKMLTVEYDEISSKTGIPLRAKAEAFRTYESGDDPIAKLLAM